MYRANTKFKMSSLNEHDKIILEFVSCPLRPLRPLNANSGLLEKYCALGNPGEHGTQIRMVYRRDM